MYSKPDVFADSVLKGFPPPSALLAAHQVKKGFEILPQTQKFSSLYLFNPNNQT